MNCCVGTYNLCINQGATFARTFIWSTLQCACAVGAAPAPVDLTGYTAEMQFRTYPLGPLLFDATPYLTLGGVAGTIALSIPPAQTTTFTWWNANYDLKLTDSSGNSTRLLEGKVTVSPAVSQ